MARCVATALGCRGLTVWAATPSSSAVSACVISPWNSSSSLLPPMSINTAPLSRFFRTHTPTATPHTSFSSLSSSSSLQASSLLFSSLFQCSHQIRRVHSSTPLNSDAHHEDESASAPKAKVTVRFITMEGEQYLCEAQEGDNLLDVAFKNRVPIPGTCGGGGAPELEFGEGPSCQFCHIYVDPKTFEKLPPPNFKEKQITPWIAANNRYSRFACEIILTPQLNGMTCVIPEYPDDRDG